MALSKDWLLEEAGTKVYYRGVDIHQSQPIKVKRNGTQYEAYIWGTEKYHVKIDTGAWEPDCSCTCPYDYGYVCKHIVALGLAILEGNFTEAEVNYIDIEEAEIEEYFDAEFYRNTFLQAPSEQQNAFIKLLFTKHEHIRAQFTRFVQNDRQAVEAVDVDIIQIKNSVHGKLDSLDISIPYDFYDDEGDGIRELGLSEIKNILQPYFSNARSKFSKGDLRAGVAILTGVYEGCHNLEEPYLEEMGVEWGVISDFESDVQEVFVEALEGVSSALNTVIVRSDKTVEAIDQLFDRVRFYNEDETSRSHPMVYDLKAWEPLLDQFISLEGAAAHVLQCLEREDLLDEPSCATLILKIANETDDEALWLESAKANATYNPKIALQLLEFYDEQGEIAAFYHLAKDTFAAHPRALSGYLADKISPKYHRTFFVQVLSFHSLNYHSIKHYEQMRDVMTEPERDMFLQSANMQWNYNFYAKVLAVEKDYEKLLNLVKKHIAHPEYIIFLRVLAQAKPEICWNMTAERIDSLLQAGQRGRDWYRSFAEELKLIGDVSSEYAQRVKALASVLMSDYPRLRALKDEFQMAKLI